MNVIRNAAAATLLLGALCAPALAAPSMVKGAMDQAVSVGELCSRMGAFDSKDVADFVAATSVTVYHVPDTYTSTDAGKSGLAATKPADPNEKACDAMTDTAGQLGVLHKALSGNPDAVKWFTSNGLDVNDAVAIVHDTANNRFDLYMR